MPASLRTFRSSSSADGSVAPGSTPAGNTTTGASLAARMPENPPALEARTRASPRPAGRIQTADRSSASVLSGSARLAMNSRSPLWVKVAAASPATPRVRRTAGRSPAGSTE